MIRQFLSKQQFYREAALGPLTTLTSLVLRDSLL